MDWLFCKEMKDSKYSNQNMLGTKTRWDKTIKQTEGAMDTSSSGGLGETLSKLGMAENWNQRRHMVCEAKIYLRILLTQE